MKRLIVCIDGTWNNADQENNGIASPTNVVKLYHAVDERDANNVEQLTYYHPDVGGEKRGFLASILGGAFGTGVSRHICSAYHWLLSGTGSQLQGGDRVFIVGRECGSVRFVFLVTDGSAASHTQLLE